MENEQQATLKLREIRNQNQSSYKLLTIPLDKPLYYELRLEAIKEETAVPKIAAEIFMLGWERYQQQKQSA